MVERLVAQSSPSPSSSPTPPTLLFQQMSQQPPTRPDFTPRSTRMRTIIILLIQVCILYLYAGHFSTSTTLSITHSSILSPILLVDASAAVAGVDEMDVTVVSRTTLTHTQSHSDPYDSLQSNSESSPTTTLEQLDQYLATNPAVGGRHLLAASSSSTGAGYTGSWSCTPYGSCGFYPTCNYNRTCSCSGGTCDPATKPLETDSCACQYTYQFGYGAWSACSVTCGPGTQSRSASCFQSDGTIVSNINCGTPVTSQACSPANANCLAWKEGGFGSCGGATCGFGVQTQTVVCWDYTLNALHNGTCPGTKPATTQACALPHCYSWNITSWSTCPATCGVASQTRIVSCHDDTAGVTTSASFCGSQPATSQICSPSIPHCYTWQTSVWSACDHPDCGWGYITRTVWCQDLTAGATVADSYCQTYSGSKPIVIDDCKVADCYTWLVPDWSSSPCPATCGVAYQTRAITCMDTTTNTPQTTNPNSYCGTPPATSQICSPALPHCIDWQAGVWGVISTDCGPGIQTRSVYCYDYTAGTTLPDSNCNAGTKLPTQQAATKGDCYNWQQSSWTTCSQTWSDNNDISLCNIKRGQLSNFLTCLVSCLPSCIFSGAGTQTRTVQCYDSTGGYIDVDTKCSGTKPITQQACQISPCYAWVAGSYGACSVTCATGTWTRSVTCQDTATNGVVANLNCAGSPPQSQDVCMVTACSDNTLASFTPSVGTLSPVFAAGTTLYTLTVASTVSGASMAATVNEPHATIGWSPAGGSVSGLVYGTPQSITCTVTAQNGGTKPYTVSVVRQASTNAYLSAITFSEPLAVLSPTFVATLTSYTIYVPDSVTTFTVTLTPQHAAGTNSYSWSPSLPLAGNGASATLTCTGISQAGYATSHLDYTIIVTRGKSSSAYLDPSASGLVPQTGTLSPAYNQMIFGYTLTANLPNSQTTLNVKGVVPPADFSTMSVVVNGGVGVAMTSGAYYTVTLDVGDNLISIKVLAQNGADFNVYKLTVHRLSSDSTLAFIDTSATPTYVIAPSFTPATTSYTMLVSASVTTLNFYATYSYRLAQQTSTFTWKDGTGATLSSGPPCSGTCTVGNGNLPALSLTTGDNILTMKIYAEDGSGPTTYVVTVHQPSSVSTMATFAFNNGLVPSPTFNGLTTFSYTVSAAYAVSSCTVTAQPTYNLAFCQYLIYNGITSTWVALVNGNPSTSIPLPVGDMEIDMNCISEDGTSSTLYKFYIHRKSNDQTIKSLSISTNNLVPSFSPTVYSYTATTTANTVSFQVITTSVYATFQHNWQGAGYGASSALWETSISSLVVNIGDNILLIKVTSEDTTTTQVYSITVHKQATDNTLSSLSVSVSPVLYPPFVTTTQDYSLTVINAQSSTTMTAVTNSNKASGGYSIFPSVPTPASKSSATYTALPAGGVTPVITLNTGYTYLVVAVQAEDVTQAVNYYTITIYRPGVGSSFYALTTLHGTTQNDFNSFPFTSFTLSYTITLPFADNTLAVNTSSTYPLSTSQYSYAGSAWAVYTNVVPIQTISVGDSILFLLCTAEDGSVKTQYQIKVHRKSNDASLSFLGVSSGLVIPTLAPIFTPTTFSLTTVVAQTVPNIVISALATYPLAVIQYSYNVGGPTTGPWNSLNSAGSSLSLVLNTGNNTVYVRVTSEDSSPPVVQTYSIVVHRLSTISSIHGMTTSILTPSPGPIAFSPGFTSAGLSYRLTVASSTTTIGCTIVPENSLSVNTYQWGGGAILPVPSNGVMSGLATAPGDQLLQIFLVSEDGLSTTTYTLLVHRVSTVVDLSQVVTSVGVTSPLVSLSQPTNFYTMDISPTTTTLAFTPTLASLTASLYYRSYQNGTTPTAYVGSISGISTGPLLMYEGHTTVQIRVIAEDNSLTPRDYTFDIHRISSNALLGSITFAGTNNLPWTPTFSPTVFNYKVNTDPASSAFTFQITQQWWLATTTYTYNGGAVTPITVAPASSTSLTLLMADAATNGVNTLVITVVAEDTISVNTYTIKIHRISNDAGVISWLPIPAWALLSTDTPINSYNTTVPNSQFSFAVTAILSSAYTKNVSYIVHFGNQVVNEVWSLSQFATAGTPLLLATGQSTQWAPLAEGNTFFHFRVTAEDGVTQTLHTIKIHRISSFTTLNSIVITPPGSGLIPPFNINTKNYLVNLPNAISSFTLMMTQFYPIMTSVAYVYTTQLGFAYPSTLLVDSVASAPISIAVGTGTIVINGTAEDATTWGIYTISVNRISNDSTISSIIAVPNSWGFIPAFSYSTTDYILSLANGYSTLQLTPTLSYPRASMVYQIYKSDGSLQSQVNLTNGATTPVLPLIVGNTTVKFIATAEDGFTVTTYTININRISIDSSISSIAFNGYDATPALIGPLTTLVTPTFSIDTLAYHLYLPNSVYKMTFSAFQHYPRAELTWFISGLSYAATPVTWVGKSTYTPLVNIQPGNNVFTFRCVAQDTNTTTDYSFTIYREGDLSALSFESLPTNIEIYPTPPFVQGLDYATVAVSFLTEAIGIKGRFYTAGVTTAWHAAAPGTIVTLINNTITGAFPLTVGLNTIWIQNTKDPWTYHLDITRAAPDVQDITLVVSPGPSLIYTPGNSFSSTVRYYSASVPYLTNVVNVASLYNTASSVVTLWIENSGIDPQILTSTIPIPLDLKQGSNLVTVLSSLDGTYIFNITRLPPDVVSLIIRCLRADGNIASPIIISPNFVGGTMGYTTALPSVMRNISFNFVLNGVPQVTPSTTVFGEIFPPLNDMGVWAGATQEPVVSGANTTWYTLDIGVNYFGIYSLRDGWYVFTVERGDADVIGIVLTGYNWDGTTTTFTQVPAFIPNQLGPRDVNIRKTTLAYTITTTYYTEQSISLVLNTGTPSNITTPATAVVSQQTMGPYPLHTLMNNLNVLSVIDGGYLYNLYQELGDVKNLTIISTTQDGLTALQPTTPLFTSGVNGQLYQLTVPYRVNRIQFKTIMITSQSAFVVSYIIPNFDCSFANTINTTFLSTNNIPSIYLPLIVGTNQFAVYSYLDNLYNHQIVRLVPDLLNLTLTLNSGHPLNSAGANYFFSTKPTPLTFASDKYLYISSVNFITEVITLDMKVTTPIEYSMVFVDALGSTFPMSMASTTGTFNLYPQIGLNTLTVTCNVDGIYVYQITRRPPDMQLFPAAPTLTGFDRFDVPLSGTGLTAIIPSLYSPTFDPYHTSTSYVATPQLTYSINIAYVVKYLSMTTYFLNTANKNYVYLQNTSYTSTNGNGVVITTNGWGQQTLATGVLSVQYELPSEGVFNFDLSSQLDGVYKFVITRLPPDMIQFQLRGWTQGLAQNLILPLIPVFDPHQYIYTLSVPFIVTTFDMECFHQRTDASYHALNTDTSTNSIATPTGVPSGPNYIDYIKQLPLKAGAYNHFKLYSLLDGEYSITIYRALPVLRGIQIQAELLNQGLAFNSVDVQLPAPRIVIYTPSNLQPTFTRGNYNYNLHVPFTVAQLKFQIDWSLNVLFDENLDANLVAGLYAASGTQAFMVDSGVGTGATPVGNLSYSGAYDLVCVPGTNIVRFLSTLDGNYTITITRSTSDITNVILAGDSRVTEPANLLPVFPAPTFSPLTATTDSRVYVVHLPFLWTAIRMQATFTQFSSVTLYDTANVTQNLLSSFWSTSVSLIQPNPLDLVESVSTFKLLSLQDGQYQFIIHRAAPDLRMVTIWSSFVTCDNSSAWMLNQPYKWNQVPGPVQTDDGLFAPAKYMYGASVEYAVTGIAMTAICGTTWSTPNVQIWMDNQLNPTPTWIPYVCNSTVGAATLDLPLLLGSNTLNINSDADGLFLFEIIRKAPTLATVAFTGYSMTTPSFTSPFPLVTPNTFTPGQFYYEIEVPYVVDRISMNFSQVDNAQLYAYSQTWDEVQDLGYLPAVNLGTDIWNVNQGWNGFELRSSLDGCYVFNITRKPVSFVTTIDIILPQPYQIPEDQIALADFGMREINSNISYAVNTSMYVAAGTDGYLSAQAQAGYQFFCGCTGDVGGSMYNFGGGSTALGSPRIFTFNPPFMGGWLGPYYANVIESTSSIDWSSTFQSTAPVSCTINNVGFTGGVQTSTSETAVVPLQLGSNQILCTTGDGIYDFTIVRGSGTWSLPAMPFHLYANQVVHNLRLGAQGVSNMAELNVQFVATQGWITPSFFPLASPLLTLLTDAAYFTYLAPYTATPTIAYLTFVRTGATAWQFDLAPIWNITILPQTTLDYSGISPVFKYYSLQTTPLIYLTPHQQTNAGGITVDVDLLDLNTLEVFPQTQLIYPPFSSSPLSFPLYIPQTSTNRSTIMRTFISGPDAAHYIRPDDVPLFIDCRSLLRFDGWKTQMFVSQAIEVTITPEEAPDVDTVVSFDIGAGAILLPDAHTIYGYDYNTPFTSPYLMTFPANSAAPQTFVLQVLPALSQNSLIIPIIFDILGPDASHFFPIQNRTMEVLRASQMSLTGIPTQMTNRAISQPITIQLADAPLNTVMVSVIVEGGGYPSPMNLTFTNGSTAQDFIFVAPYWYTGVPHGVVLVNISFVASDLDAGAYYVPPPITVRITQIAADVRAVQFYARGADGVDVDMSNNMTPFVGNHLYYEQQLNIAVMDPDSPAAVGYRRRLLSTTTSLGTNVSVSARAVFVTGATVIVTLDNDYNGIRTSRSEYLTSGVMSSYFDLMEGTNYFHVNSSLDGPYLFKFQTATVTNPGPCITQARADGTVPYGLPTTSFINNSPGDLVASTGQKNITNSTIPQILFCSTVADVLAHGEQLRQDYLNRPQVSVSLASDPKSSWVYLVLMGAYFLLAVSGGIAVGKLKVLTNQVTEEFSSLVLPSPAHRASMVHQAGRFGKTIIKHTKTFMLATMAFSLPHLVLILCALRAADMMLYHSFSTSMSLEIFRLAVGYPHVFLLWIFTGLFQQVRGLLRLETKEDTNELPGAPKKVMTLGTSVNGRPESSKLGSGASSTIAVHHAGADTSKDDSNKSGSTENVSDKYAPGSARPSVSALVVARPPAHKLWFQKLSSPHHPFALWLNGTLTFVFTVMYAFIAFLAHPVTLETNLERYILSLLTFVVGFYILTVFARLQDEQKRMNLMGLEQNAEAKLGRIHARKAMIIMLAAAAIAMLLLIVVVDHTDITKPEFAFWVITFSIAEVVYLSLILWLVHGAIREQRSRMIQMMNSWKGDQLLDGIRMGKDGRILLEGEEDEPSQISSLADDSETDSEDELHLEVNGEPPTAVDILLDSAAYATSSTVPGRGVNTWVVPTTSASSEKTPEEKKADLKQWVLFFDIFNPDDSTGECPRLDDKQLDELMEHGHTAESMGPFLKQAQDDGIKFPGVPDLLVYLDRLKAEKEAMEAQLALELAEIMKFMNEDADLLRRLPKYDGTPNGQSLLTIEDAARGLGHFLQLELAGPPMVNPNDKVAMEAAKVRARAAMLDACHVLQSCAYRFPTTESFLTAVMKPLPVEEDRPAIRQTNVHLDEANMIVNYVNDDTNLLRPKRGRLLLTVADAETILHLVQEQHYSRDEYEYDVYDKKQYTAGHRGSIISGALPLGNKRRILSPIKPKSHAHDSALGDSIEGITASTPSKPASPSNSPRERHSISSPSRKQSEVETVEPASPSHAIDMTGLSNSTPDEKKKPLPVSRRPLLDDVISRLSSWQTAFMKFETVEQLVDAFRLTPAEREAEEKAAAEAKLEAELQRKREAEEAERQAKDQAERDRLAAEAREREAAEARALAEEEAAKLLALQEQLEQEQQRLERLIAERKAREAQAELEAKLRKEAEEAAEAERQRQREEAERLAALEAERLAFEKEQAELLRLQEEAAAAAVIAQALRERDEAEQRLRLQREAEAAALLEQQRLQAQAEAEAARKAAEEEAAALAALQAQLDAEAAAAAAAIAEAVATNASVEEDPNVGGDSDSGAEPEELGRKISLPRAGSRRLKKVASTITRARSLVKDNGPTGPEPIIPRAIKKVSLGFGSNQGREKLTADELRVLRQQQLEEKKKEREMAAVAAFQASIAPNNPSGHQRSMTSSSPVTISLSPAASPEPRPSRRRAESTGNNTISSLPGIAEVNAPTPTSPINRSALVGTSGGGSMWARIRIGGPNSSPQSSSISPATIVPSSPSNSATGLAVDPTLSPSFSPTISSPTGGNGATFNSPTHFSLNSPGSRPRVGRPGSLLAGQAAPMSPIPTIFSSAHQPVHLALTTPPITKSTTSASGSSPATATTPTPGRRSTATRQPSIN